MEQPYQHSELRILASRTGRQSISVVQGAQFAVLCHSGSSKQIQYFNRTTVKTYALVGHQGGSVFECLPLAQVVIPGSWDRVPHQAPCREPASPSACVSASLCVSHESINQSINQPINQSCQSKINDPGDPWVAQQFSACLWLRL